MDERKPPTSRDDSELEALVESFAERIRRGESPSIEEYAARYPHLAERIREIFPSLEYVEKVQREEPRSTEDASIPAAPATVDGKTLERLGDYRILREIGRGGMGIVYEAEQESLGRHVALKVLPFHRLMHPKYLERFLREARAAAALQHPNIVPVYNVGVEEDIHYYAMQFIVGQGLDQVLEELRRLRKARGPADGATPSSSASSTTVSWFGGSAEAPSASDARYFKSVARIGLKVAEALSYAHGQGLLHRDIKPSNLLLDAKGNVWVTDFGLAKVEGSDDLTHTGEVVGTLRYMAPERFGGWSDPRSDIYSLGLTLYELLTLQPAFDDTDRGRLVKHIAEEDPARPRRLDGHVPRDLETIVTKSIAKEPGQRYQTADDLAADLGHFLAGEPIRARASTVWERGVKWAKRRPALSGMIGLSTLALCALFVGVLWYNARLRASVTETDQALAQAETNFQKAREAVDKILTRVAEKKLANVPQMVQVRREVLEDALAFYQWFLEVRGWDPAVRHQTAEAYGRVAQVYMMIDQDARAEEMCREAIALLEDLVAGSPGDPRFRWDLANQRASLADLLMKMGRSEDGEQAYRQALAFIDGGTGDFSELGSRIHNNLGLLLEENGRPKEAEEAFRKAISLRRLLRESNPTSAGFRYTEAQSRYNLARSLLIASRLQEAEGYYEEALAAQKKLVAEDPDSRNYRHELARTHYGLGIVFVRTGRPQAMRDMLCAARDIQAKLVEDFPDVNAYRIDLSLTYNSLARLFFEVLREPEKAAEVMQQALPLQQKLADDMPNVPQYKQVLAETHMHLGLTLKETGNLQEASDCYDRALPPLRKLVEEFDSVPAYRASLSALHKHRISLLVAMGRGEDGIEICRESLLIDRELSARFPENPGYQHTLGSSLHNMAWSLHRRGELAEARRLCEEGIGCHRRALEAGPKDTAILDELRMAYSTLADILVAQGDHEELSRGAGDLSRMADGSWQEPYTAARFLGRCMRLAGTDPGLSEEERVKAIESYAGRALDLLERGLRRGSKDLNRLRKDRDLEPLHGHDGFEKLLSRMEALWAADCNKNGTEDSQDISSGASKDCNSNGVPDECELSPSKFVGFAACKSYEAGMTPYSLALGDWDGDGDFDVATVVVLLNVVWVWQNKGDGTFFKHREYAAGPDPVFVASGDFNGDGWPDLATVNRNSSTVSILLNRGDGRFQAPEGFAVGSWPLVLSIGDFDQDLDLDIAVANRDSASTSVLLNDGHGAFAERKDYPVGSHPFSVAIGDLDGDGLLDLAVANRDSNSVSVLRNRGDGTFAAKEEYAAGPAPLSVAIGDFDGDGKPDLAVTHQSQGTAGVLRNEGDGAFADPKVYIVGDLPYSVTVADWDGDGDLDIVAACALSGCLSFLRNDGRGEFTRGLDTSTGGEPTFVSAGDLDGDSRLDLASGNEGSGSFFVAMCAWEAVDRDCDKNGIPDECDADCNANGVPDCCDIKAGTSRDDDGDGVPDECEEPLMRADTDADGS